MRSSSHDVTVALAAGLSELGTKPRCIRVFSGSEIQD
jgi:hypothetical protein